MRIDLNQAAASQITNEAMPKQPSIEELLASDPGNSGDRTTLTSTPQPLNELVRNAMSSPEIRQDRVDSLKQSIDNGTYELDPAKIASSMIDEQA
jgi:negative regulator of flagellin synthesis FlgM